MVEPEMSRGGRHRNVRICREARGSRVRLSAACRLVGGDLMAARDAVLL
jgi:hypothetical protein